tara:strand:+ start:415 stop:684 length:270 start_codon:yes stop_codon:yes gene_type:complete
MRLQYTRLMHLCVCFMLCPQVCISKQRCLELVIPALYTVLMTIYNKNRAAGLALFDASLQHFLQAFRLEYAQVVQLCVPHGYEPLERWA